LETSEIDFRDSPNLDFELAEAYNYKKLNNTSLLLYQSAMQKFPLKEIIPMKIAIHFYEEKNAAYALKAVERALSLNPDYSDAIQLKALILEKQGYTKQAQQLLEENLSKHPKHQKSLIALAELFFSQQNFEEAAKTYEKCIINEAETSEIAIKAYFTAKQGYCHFKNNDYSLALALVEKALQLEPDHLPAIQTQGELLFAMGKPEKAIQVLTELIKINSDSDEARFILAKHFIKNGDREKGSNILQPILKKFPYHKEVFQLLNQ
jgi:tetratricopeptide (TPR) repeat protein